MKCFKCGRNIPDGSRFCSECGATVSDPAAETVAVATEEKQDALLENLRTHLAEDYDVQSELGRGGMAVVFKATERALGRPVAIKVLPPEMAQQTQTLERFKREARMAAQLDHPNIIPIHRVGTAGGMQYIAMKMVEGRALDEIVEDQGALPINVVLTILRGTSSGLAFAHERGIVHRDIKGANILIERDGRVLLSDFGIARAAEDKTLTATGAVIGTPYFMSPEQCSGQKVAPQSDQYSLALVGFQMLTGQVPYEADSVLGIMHHHFFTPLPSIRELRDDVPEELLAVIERAAAKEPDSRFAHTTEMVEAFEAIPFPDAERREATDVLKKLAAGQKLPIIRTRSLPPLTQTQIRTHAAEPTRLVRPRRKGRRGLIAGGVLGVAAAVAAVVFAVPRLQQTQEGLLVPPSPIATADSDENVATPPEQQRSVDSVTQPAAPVAADTQPAVETVEQSRPPPPEATRQTAQPSGPPPAEEQPAGYGRLRMRVTPPTAVIFVDDDSVGVGTVFDLEIPAGLRRIRAVAPGYAPFDTTLTVETDRTYPLTRVALQGGGGS